MFGRDLSSDEWTGYRKAVKEAKDSLEIRRLGVITPVRSLPSHTNTGVGSLPAAKDFFTFLTELGFDTVQIDPEGKTKLVDPSPYAGTVFSLNPLSVDLKPLVDDPAWGGLLKKETLEAIERDNPKPNGDRVAYSYILPRQEAALTEAYETYLLKLGQVDSLPAEEAGAIRSIHARFKQFLEDNAAWLEPDALYEALTAEYGNDYWPHWKGEKAELDKNLFNTDDRAAAQARIVELKKKHAGVIGAYQFTQFLASEQKKDFKVFAKQHNLSLMADRQVGFSDRDVWAYRKLFLPGWSLGAPPDYFSKTGQAWGFPVLDPDKLFNADGSLGEGGQLLKRLFAKMFEENPGGVRIDHIIGLIDPWVYPAGQNTTLEGARLFSAPDRPDLAKYAFVSHDALNWDKKKEIDEDEDIQPENKANAWQASEERVREDALTDGVVAKYARILDEIVMAAAREKGVSKDSIICEDLGTLTNPVKKVLEKQGFSGIRVTQFVNPEEPEHLYRGKNADPKHWITTGTHDNVATLAWARDLAGKEDVWKHADYLTADLVPNDAEKDAYRHELGTNPLALVRAKFVELFASPARQAQIFFADLFGMEETYNRPGTTGDDNWSLRVPKQFRQAYVEAIKNGRGLNLPEVLAQALKARQIDKPELVTELEKYARLLKE